MRGRRFRQALACFAGSTVVGLALAGCGLIPFPLAPRAPLATTKLAADPISVTLRGGIPVVRMCEAATVGLIVLNESLIANDLSKGYVDVWVANGHAHLAKGAEFAVGTAPAGLKSTQSTKQIFDFSNDYWDLTLDDGYGLSKTISQKFRAGDLIEGFWLDYKGRAAPGPCELGQ
jgi:hypothetical protein